MNTNAECSYHDKKSQWSWFLATALAVCFQTPVIAKQWKLEKHADQYQISIEASQGERLIVSHQGENSRFILQTSAKQQQPDDRQLLQFWFDNETSIVETGLTRLDKLTYLIQLSDSQKTDFLKRMINHIDLKMRYVVKEQTYHEITFSLLGFTAVLNDLLIAHEIGHLDPEWLNENHKTQELMCYYAANFSVLAMLYRKQGLSDQQSINKMKKQYTEALEELITDIVLQVYRMPRSKLPRDPRGDKFGLFKRCMQHYQQES